MIDTSAKNMLIEIRAGEKLRDDHLRSVDNQIARFHGPAWKGSPAWEEMDYDPKNRGFQYIAQVLPEVAFDNPRFSVKSKRGEAQKAVAEAIRHGMNRWAIDTSVEEVAEQVATDAQFSYGVLVVSQVPTGQTDPGTKEPRMRPQMYRRSPREFGIDAHAKDIKDARFMFDIWVADKADLVKLAKEDPDSGWNAEALEALTTDVGLDKLSRPTKDSASRNEIVGYAIWIPEEELEFTAADAKKYKAKSWREAGFNGTVRTIAVGQTDNSSDEGQEIRDPMPYYGPPSGPYQVVGMYYVPDSAIPLGTLTAVEAQNQELNQHARAYLRSAARRKSIGIVSGNDSLLVNAVNNAQDGETVTANVAEIKNNWIQAEFQGPTEIQRLTLLDLEANFDNSIGTSDSLRGAVTGVGTATENNIAAQSASSRTSWNRKKFHRQFGQACKKVAWFLYHDDRVVFPLGEEAAGEMEMPEPWFHGGTHGEGSGYTFEDLELEIEAKSMTRVDEAATQQKALAALTLVTSWMPLMIQFPGAAWGKLIDEAGDAFDVPNLSELVGVEGVIQSGLMMMAMMAGAGGTPGGEAGGGGMQVKPQKPRLAGDSGGQRQLGGGIGKSGKLSPAKNPSAGGKMHPKMLIGAGAA